MKRIASVSYTHLFARSCFNYALATKQDLWFSTKDTISKKYDHTFKDIFADIYEAEYRHKFESLGITYFYTLIDDCLLYTSCLRRYCRAEPPGRGSSSPGADSRPETCRRCSARR